MRIPKYRKHSSGQARVTLGGRTYYLGKYGSKASRDEYNRLVGEFIANSGTIIPANARGDLSIAELMLAYVRWARGHYGRDSTEFDKIKRIIRRTKKTYSRTKASDFGYAQFEAVRKSLVADGNGRTYINESMFRLVRIFKWSASRGLIPAMVPQALSMIEPLKCGRTEAPEPTPVRPVDPDIVEQTLPFLSRVVADMVQTQFLTSCRPGEVCRITPGMIDRSGDVWEINLKEHKTAHRGKSRTLYVGPRAQKILASYLLRPDDQHCFRPVDSERQRRIVQHSERKTPIGYGNSPGTNRKRKPRWSPGESYNSNTYRKAVQRACDKAFPPPDDLPDEQVREWNREHRWSPNQLRHTAGTLIRRTEGIEAARLLLGHSDAQVTTIYAEADRQKAIDAALRVG